MNYIFDEKPQIIQYDNSYISQIEEKIKNKEKISENEINDLLDYVCYTTRCKFDSDIENYDFSFKCDVAQAIITYYFLELGITTHPCMTQNVITNDIVGHSFLIVEINNKNYLVDPTYRQFTKYDNCKEDKYFNYNNIIIKTPDPGYFIRENDKKEFSSFLIKGYNELTEEFARIYGDSFYNTKVGTTSKKFNSIPGKAYINSFIKGNELLSKTKEELDLLGLSINNSQKHL